MSAGRERLDKLLVERGLIETRERAQAVVLAGRVFVAGQRADKPGTQVPRDAALEVRGDACPYVSRGGLKLAGVLEPLGVEPAGLVCADIGASTGGFTDVLLQRGAVKVYAVDVGRGQLHQKLRADPRVVVREGVNARFPLGEVVTEPVGLIVMDVSFISLTRVLPAALDVLAAGPLPGGREPCLVAMVKPQFELTQAEVGRGGVVRDDALRERAVRSVVAAAEALGLREVARCDSPVAGPAGNREVFVHLVRRAAARGGPALDTPAAGA
jgi:23S rRNA (cytidine1920-2'-O)/16S rRNA (cytidine1409-2'-O)-methyltransferase